MVFARPILASLVSPTWCGSLSASSSCYWHVSDQTIVVEAPVIYDAQVESECPHERFGVMHEKICTDCKGLDNQCGGEFVACVGCCKLPKPNRFHSCTNIKNYFFKKNSKSVACDARMDLEDGDVDVQYGKQTTQRNDSGSLVSNCNVKVGKVQSKAVPVKLKFDCSNCATEGVPDLLRQCCDKAAEFSKGAMVQKLQQEGFTVFLWADGCHDKWIGPKDNLQEFKQAYPALKESKIDADMNTFVEQKYCANAVEEKSDKCPANGPRRLLRNSSVGIFDQENSSRRLGEDCGWLEDAAGSDPLADAAGSDPLADAAGSDPLAEQNRLDSTMANNEFSPETSSAARACFAATMLGGGFAHFL